MKLRFRWALIAIIAVAFGLRMIHLADVPPRWDEGWSIAHASLPWPEIFSITAQDVHPPLYYVLLSLWQSLLGVNLFTARLLSVFIALPAIPLGYITAQAWARSNRVAILAAALMAALPLLVYYSAVVRMYALAPTFILLATYAALRLSQSPRPRSLALREAGGGAAHIVRFIIGATGAMLTLYHAAWALAALGVYLLLMAALRRANIGRILIAIALSALAFAPWAIFALPILAARAAAESATNTGQQLPLSYFIQLAISGLTLSQFSHGRALIVIAAIVLLGIITALLRRRTLLPLLLPVLMITATVVFVSIAARQWALNERMLVGAAPALVLLLAWSLDGLPKRHQSQRPATFNNFEFLISGTALGIAALIVVYWQTSTDFVYRKSLEVFDPYNPHTYFDHIAPHAQPDDIAFFNVLSPAGFYALDRQPNSPRWSYALTWDPVKEPPQEWQNRILSYAQMHSRMWFVLYRGLAGKNGDLRGWLDSSFYPARAEWGEEEVFYGLYGFPSHALVDGSIAGANWGAIHLAEVQHSPQVQAGDIAAVRLDWQLSAKVPKNYKIFVHARSADGAVVAQHDAMPLNDLRPMTTLPLSERIRDNHGLDIPKNFTGHLTLILGLYDPDTGQRLLTDDGKEEIRVGSFEVN